MLFIELLVPKGVLDEQERRRLAGRLTGRRLLSPGEGETAAADPGVIDLFDSLTNVVVREEAIWVAGGSPADAAQHPRSPQDPRFVVNVIAGMWGKEMGEHLISRITRELVGAGDKSESQVVVNVISLPEGSYGLGGKARRSSDMLRLIEDAKTGPTREVPEGMLVDPVCGATVPLEDAVILEHDGQTYGFCCSHCRGHFVRQQRDAEVS